MKRRAPDSPIDSNQRKEPCAKKLRREEPMYIPPNQEHYFELYGYDDLFSPTPEERFSQAIVDLSQNPNDSVVAKSLRERYLEWISSVSTKDSFVSLANKVRSLMNKDVKSDDKIEKGIYVRDISSKEDPKYFHSNCVVVGRFECCDLKIDKSEFTVSRVHAIIIFLKDKTIVVDIGSLNGIRTISRTTKKECLHSLHDSRKVLEFEKDEEFTLELGKVKFEFVQKK